MADKPLILKNKGGAGIYARLVSEPYRQGKNKYIYTIEFHHVLGKYVLDECTIIPQEGKPDKPFGKIIGEGTIEELMALLSKITGEKIRIEKE